MVNFRGPLIRDLVLAGWEVHAAGPGIDETKGLRQGLEALGAKVHDCGFDRAGLNPVQDIVRLTRLWRLLRQIQPDVFLGYTIKPVTFGMIAASLARVPRRVAMITGLGYAFTGEAKGFRSWIRQLVIGLYRIGIGCSHSVIFQNSDDLNDLRQIGVVPTEKPVHIVAGSGVDLDRFPAVAFPEGPPVFLMIARLIGDKGVREYVTAARQVREQYPEIRYLLVGGADPNPDGIPADEAESWVDEGIIEWLGPLEDVRPALAMCTVYVLPSYREGTPRTVLEAMATGRAIITTDVPGCRETIRHGVEGLLVEPRNSGALLKAMLELVENPERVQSMSHASLARARQKYDVKRVNADIISVVSG